MGIERIKRRIWQYHTIGILSRVANRALAALLMVRKIIAPTCQIAGITKTYIDTGGDNTGGYGGYGGYGGAKLSPVRACAVVF